MLDKACDMEVDWEELAKEEPNSNYQDSRDAAGT
jgi:hypothetical protein